MSHAKEETGCYIALSLTKWKNLVGSESGQGVTVPEECGYGFAPAFRTREEAERHYPNRTIIEAKAEPR